MNILPAEKEVELGLGINKIVEKVKGYYYF